MGEQFKRQYLNKEIEVELLDPAHDVEAEFPVRPVKLTAEDRFCFQCKPDSDCWNRCCHGADITLTPADILRLSRHIEIPPSEFLLNYAVPVMWDKADLPVAKLRMTGNDGKGACPFMAKDGCAVYEHRPATCRYYPLGLASVKMKGAEELQDFFFLVKERHCRGHEEGKALSVDGFREEQGLDPYDQINRGWIDILMKMASWKVVGGPFGQGVNAPTQKMFFMVSTDVEKTRRFFFQTKFFDSYEIDEKAIEALKTDDEAVIRLGLDWMKQVLFNDQTIRLKETVLHDAIVRARREMGVA